jgi:hypothetical protein
MSTDKGRSERSAFVAVCARLSVSRSQQLAWTMLTVLPQARARWPGRPGLPARFGANLILGPIPEKPMVSAGEKATRRMRDGPWPFRDHRRSRPAARTRRRLNCPTTRRGPRDPNANALAIDRLLAVAQHRPVGGKDFAAEGWHQRVFAG